MSFPQLVQSWAHPGPISALFPDDSLARIPIEDLKEIRQLSRFLPLIVLIPKSHVVKDHGVLSEIAATSLCSKTRESISQPRNSPQGPARGARGDGVRDLEVHDSE